jgi:hypothetical protein
MSEKKWIIVVSKGSTKKYAEEPEVKTGLKLTKNKNKARRFPSKDDAEKNIERWHSLYNDYEYSTEEE